MAAVNVAATQENHAFALAAFPLFAEKPHLGHQPSSATFRLGTTLAISSTVTAMPGCLYDSGTRPRCTGKERENSGQPDLRIFSFLIAFRSGWAISFIFSLNREPQRRFSCPEYMTSTYFSILSTYYDRLGE